MAFRLGGNTTVHTSLNNGRPRPQNTGLSKRARDRLNFEADNMIDQRQASIEADPTDVVIWHRGRGATPCTCTAGQDANSLLNRAAALNPADKSPAAQKLRREAGGWAQRGGPLGDYSTDDFEGGIPVRNPNSANRIEPDLDEDFPAIESSADRSDPNSTGLAQLSEIIDSGPFQGAGVDKCPICFGTGFTDAYKPSRAVRLLGDFAPTTDVSVKGGNYDQQAHPYVFNMSRGASAVWNLFVPRYFQNTLRVSVWNGLTPIKGVLPQIQIGGNWKDATLSTLNTLNGVAGTTYPFRMMPQAKDFGFTHFEIIFEVGNFVHAFVDELNIPYDAEFVDYNTMVDAELPVTAVISPGDVLTENKHGRVWVASTVTKNRLANDKAVSQTLSLRAVANDEVYHPMNLFRTPYIP